MTAIPNVPSRLDGVETVTVPLTPVEEFLVGYRLGPDEGALSPWNHIVHAWRLIGNLNEKALHCAVSRVVAVQSALRTSFHERDGRVTKLVQREGVIAWETVTCVPAPILLDEDVDALLADAEARPIHIDSGAPVRFSLVRGMNANLFIIRAHHLVVDGLGVRALARAIFDAYHSVVGGDSREIERSSWPPDPNPQGSVRVPDLESRLEAWEDRLSKVWWGAAPTCLQKSLPLREATGAVRAQLPDALSQATRDLAQSAGTTPFAIQMTAFVDSLAARRRDLGPTLAIPTFLPGRNSATLDSIGPLLNFAPVVVRAREDGGDFSRRAQDTARSIKWTVRNEVPAAELFAAVPNAVGKMFENDRCGVVFQSFPMFGRLRNAVKGGLLVTEVEHRLLDSPRTSDIPNGSLWTLNNAVDRSSYAAVQYNTNLHCHAVMRAWLDELVERLERATGGTNGVEWK